MNRHFLSLDDIDGNELHELFGLADDLRISRRQKPLAGTTSVLIFQKPSLRTRVSFEVGIADLGGNSLFLSQEGVGIGTRESAADVARVLSRYSGMIIARLFDHTVLEEIAAYATIPVINALTDLSHPCQIMADLYTLRAHRKLLPGMKVVFVGDGNNVVNSWLEASMLFPMQFVVAAPEGFEPDPALVARARQAGVSSIEIVNDPREAAVGADVLYTDVWTSMGQEDEAVARKEAFAGFQVNESLLDLASGDAVVMHCLPAHRGEEISAGVLDGPQSIVFDQSEGRLHIQKAIVARLMQESGGVGERASGGEGVWATETRKKTNTVYTRRRPVSARVVSNG
jgi:ornithine carbamoyltransferase